MSYFAILDRDEVVACASRAEAQRVADEHLAKGHPLVRSASIYEAASEALLREVVLEGKEPVRFVFAGIPRNYYDSDEWRAAQAARDARRLAEDVAYCPRCGEGNVEVAM